MRRAAFLLLSVPLGFVGYAARSSTYSKIDRCLAQPDSAWNYRTRSCEGAPDGPVDRIYIDKSEHWMAAYRQGQIIREFRVSLGPGGLKPKEKAGDGRVPEGLYTISMHNPVSAYHLSLRISYPTLEQSAEAAARGVNPGGDIMIHGLPNGKGWIGAAHRTMDWTLGCVALTDDEIDEVWKLVPVGTPVDIRP